MSMVAGPPASHSRMTLLAFALSEVSFFAAASLRSEEDPAG